MLQVVTGFAVVGFAIFSGFIIGKTGVLGPQAGYVLSRLVFFLLTPVLMFTIMAEADPKLLFSPLLLVSTITAAVIAAIAFLLSRFVFKSNFGESLMFASVSSMVNSNNIGLPLSLYILGSVAYPAPVLLVQLLLFFPIILAGLEVAVYGRSNLIASVRRAVLNPLILGAVLGLSVSLLNIELPPLVWDPVTMLAGSTIPVLLVNFGIALATRSADDVVPVRRGLLVTVVILKLLVMPLVAYLLGAFVLQLPYHDIFVVTLLAALPAAQNVFNYAQRYDVGFGVTRDAVAITTLGCVPVVFIIALLFH